MTARVSRRGVLAGAAALALARPAAAGAAQSHAERTARALIDLISRERAAALAYRAVGRVVLARHDEEHAAALVPHLQSVGHRPPPPVRDVAQLDGPVRALAEAPPARRDQLGVALEHELIQVYSRALGSLYDPATKRTAATIMASHGQHAVLLSRNPYAAWV